MMRLVRRSTSPQAQTDFYIPRHDAATPYIPWGTQPGAGQVFNEEALAPKIIGYLVAGFFGMGLLMMASCVLVSVVKNSREKRRQLANSKQVEKVNPDSNI